MNFKIKLIVFFLPVLLWNCSNGVDNSTAQVTPDDTPESRTIASLEKLDDYPFYTMTYYCDYNFAERAGRENAGLSSNENMQEKNLPFGCTCFSILTNNNGVLARNFDWDSSIPLLLFTNPPNGYASVSTVDIEFLGYNRQNLPDDPSNRQNLLNAPFWPFDGMNEMGVSIGMMAVPSARSPYDASKISLGEIDAIRLILDYAASTEEAIQLLGEYNIIMENPPIHYLIADKTSHSAIIEFVDGEMIVMRNDDPWQVSTNFIIYGSSAPANTPCWRWNTVYSMVIDLEGLISPNQAMTVLHNVISSTKWSVVYNTGAGDFKYSIGENFNTGYEFNIGDFNN